MRAYVVLALLAVVSAVGFAPAPLPRRERFREDPRAIFGKWEFEAWEMRGQKSGFSQYLEFTESETHFISLQGGGKVTYQLVIKPELSPKGFQWIIGGGGGGGGWIGSYRVEGDRLTLIFHSGSSWKDRPVDFNATHEYRFILRKKR